MGACDFSKKIEVKVMIEYRNVRPASVIGPCGEILTLGSLPPPHATRWVARRKAEVVVAVEGGLLTVDEVLQRYELSLEEFVSWRRAMDRGGISNLRATWLQEDRHNRKHKATSDNTARKSLHMV